MSGGEGERRPGRGPLALGLALSLATLWDPSSASLADQAAPPPHRYRPKVQVSETLKPFVDEIGPGSDLVPDERVARLLNDRLSDLALRIKQDPSRLPGVAEALLASSFRGGGLLPTAEDQVSTDPSLRIARGREMATALTLDRRSFGSELRRLLADHRKVLVAEFLITSLELTNDATVASTEVRYDIVGPGKTAWRVQRLGTWRLRWQLEGASWRVSSWTAASHLIARTANPVFTDVSEAAFGSNDSFRHQLSIGFDSWITAVDSVLTRDSNAHNGVSVGDVNGDGLDDIYAAQPHGFPNRLFRNRGDGTFEDVTERSGMGVLEDTSHSLFVDVDDDGDQDLLLTISSGPALFLNDGEGRFTQAAGAFGTGRVLEGAPMSMAVADYDRDGRLDLYLSVYSFYYGAGEGKGGTPVPYHDAENGPPNVLYRNLGGGRFVDVTNEVGLGVANDRFSFGAAWGDYDGDGWPDLVVTNDFGRKNLYRNLGLRDGAVRFEHVTAEAGVEDHAAGMGITWLDYDGDGRLDIYAGQMWSDNGLRVTASPAFLPEADERTHAIYRHHARGNSLFRNRGDGTFEDVTLEARAEMGRWTWSTSPIDFDSDGWEDLYCVNGMVTRLGGPEDLDWFFWGGIIARSPLVAATGTPYDDAWRAINRLMVHRSIASRHRNVFLRNDGRGGFDDISGALGLDLDQDGRAFAVLDYDGDGDADLVPMAARSTPQLRLFRNDYDRRGATLALRLTGDPSHGNRDAIGARVTVETEIMRRVKVVTAGSGFLSQHSKELLFGLGESKGPARVTIDWPDGRSQELSGIALDRRVRVEQGGEPEVLSYATPRPRPQKTLPTPPASTPNAIWLHEPVPAPDFALPDLRGEERTLSSWLGRPVALLLWAAEAPSSRTALETLAQAAKTLEAAGIAALAVALDPPEASAAVRSAAAKITAFPVIHASEEVGLSYGILHRHLFLSEPDIHLPTTLLLDREGRVVRLYRGPIDTAALARDVPQIEATPDQRLERALPFPGLLYNPPPDRNYMAYGRELQDNGLDGPALGAFEKAAQGRPNSSTLYRLGTLLVKASQPEKARSAFERALQMQPNLAEASNDLGTLLARSGDVHAAIDRFRAALEAAPDYPDALNNLGYALLLTGRATDARALYEKALALQPDFPEAMNNLGLVHGRAGELDLAEPHFRKALQKRPGYAEAANNLALVLVGRDQVDEAKALLQEFIERNPAAESTRLTLAKVHLSRGESSEGLAVVRALLERNPSHAQALELKKRFE